MISVAFEGLPGAGKTTITRALKKENPDIKLIKERIACPYPFDPNNEEINNCRDIWYLGKNLEVSKKIKENSIQKCNMLIDRYYPSTLCFSYVFSKRGNTNNYNKLKNIVDSLKKDDALAEPSLYLYLKLPHKTSIERHTERTSEHEKLKILKNDETFILGFNQFYDNFFEDRKNIYIIDGLKSTDVLLPELKRIFDEYANKNI